MGAGFEVLCGNRVQYRIGRNWQVYRECHRQGRERV